MTLRLLVFAVCAVALPAQDMRQFGDRALTLRMKLEQLPDSDLRKDVEVYAKAAEWALRFPEELTPQGQREAAEEALTTGLARAESLARGESPWKSATGRVARGYRSKVDGTVQPYGMVIPASYDGSKPMRLDVVLHGRAATMTESSFLAAHEGGKPVPPELDHLQLEVYGRGNNAYRWAGETDVFEALESAMSRYKVDPERIVLRGFSMGGAGAWHIGLHHPFRWAAIEAGAGFVETKRYAKLTDIPGYVEPTLHIYDATDYASNIRNVAAVGYGGELDPQLKASQTIEELVKNVPERRALFLVGPKTEHKWHPDSLRESEAFLSKAVSQRPAVSSVSCVTWTPRYGSCGPVAVEALERQYERATVEGTLPSLKTSNVLALRFEKPTAATLDGQVMRAAASFVKRDGKWRAGEVTGLCKRAGLQGPIDDAFMDPFVVLGEVPAALRRDWAKWMRGHLPERDVVSPEEIKQKHLVLFGTPDSNPMIAQIHKQLPIHWDGADIVLGSKRYPSATHRLAMIYPNPLNPSKYVVLNTLHSFGEKEFKGTNALLYPHWGDWAILDASGVPVAAGLFNENWLVQAGL